MSIRRISFFLLVAVAFLIATGIPIKSNPGPDDELVAGRNVNMVAGDTLPDGDPFLQRQNEPSIAVSTRNPLHLLAGANDYRSVGFAESEGELPGQEPGTPTNSGDAWLGVFKSYNGGQSWRSTLLPGCLYHDTTPTELKPNPLYGYGAAADPTVRSGPNGMFYYSGITFDRIEHGRSALFVARFIDNNFTKIDDSIQDPIKYIDTTIIDTGTSGQFADKPWIAVDIPRFTPLVNISGPGIPDQNIPAHNVYIAYSIFLGDLGSENVHNKILFARSTDCGATWEHPTKLSEGEQVNQGTIIAVSPKDGTIYVAWRRFKERNTDPSLAKQPDAILVCKSEDFGRSFNKPVEVATIEPFDQITTEVSFRTSTMPALAVDDNGIAYVAWADTGWNRTEENQYGEAKITISCSKDGINWSDPEPIENFSLFDFSGHQIMPSLTFAAGKLMMTWYDTRNSEGGYSDVIADTGPSDKRHTMDVFVSQALPSYYYPLNSNPPENPAFLNFTQVSRYLYQAVANDYGDTSQQYIEIEQVQFNHPNYPLFMGGTKPFFGDYIDISPGPQFLYELPNFDDQSSQNGSWRFNTGKEWDPAIYHITWADNRDVLPPDPDPCPDPDGIWKIYNTPGTTGGCAVDTTGKRNQNIYTSQITQGIAVGSPTNTKPLDEERTFLIFAKNLTDVEKYFLLTIETPTTPLMDASFWETGPPQVCEYPLLSCGNTEVKVAIAPHSSLTLTVFVQPYANTNATLRVKVEELNAIIENDQIIDYDSMNGFQGYVILNPDPINTQTIADNVELPPEEHNPIIISELPDQNIYPDPSIISDYDIDPDSLQTLLSLANPDIVAPSIRSPSIRSDAVVNPSIRSPSIRSYALGEATDLQWTVTNNGNTTSAYSFYPIGETPPVQEDIDYQLLIYRVNNTPISDACMLIDEEHHELILKIDNPSIRSPSIRSPSIRSPSIRSNTFFLAPGETAICTLRLIDPTPNPFDPEDYAKTVAGAAIPQAYNPDGEIEVAAGLFIINASMPDGTVGQQYLDEYGGVIYLEADGGSGTYVNWEIVAGKGDLPPELDLVYNSDLDKWLIEGIPIFKYNVCPYPETYNFTVGVEDSNGDIAHRNLSITIKCEPYNIRASATLGGKIEAELYEGDMSSPPYNVAVECGQSQKFTITPDVISPDIPCWYVADVIIDEEIHLGKDTAEYTFVGATTDVTIDHTIHAVFERITYTITATAGVGGSINPAGPVPVKCGSSQIFIITPDDGFRVLYLIVDRDTENPIYLDPVTEYTFTNVLTDHTIHAEFGWVKRYNNDSADGDDEASDIAVDPSGIVYVTGYSRGSPTGDDYYTTSYNSLGIEGLKARYDGPAHEGDRATAIALDDEGNVYVTGYSFRGMAGTKHKDYCTLKYNSSRELVWDSRYDARRNGDDMATDIAVYTDATGKRFLYVTGKSEESLSKKSDKKHYDYYTIKYNANTGRTERGWGARYNNSWEVNNSVVNGHDEATAIAVFENPTGKVNVYVTGRSKGNGTGFDFVTIKYDANLENPIVKRYNNDSIIGDDEATAIAIDDSGNVYVTGRSEGNKSGFDYVTIKYDANLENPIVKRYNNDSIIGDDEATAIAIDDSGNVYVTGRSEGNKSGFDYVTIKYGANLENPIIKRYNNDSIIGDDEATAIAIDDSGNVYVTGRSQGSTTGYDYCTIKYDSSGNVVWIDRYNNDSVNGDDEATAIAVDIYSGNVYITGKSKGNGTRLDYVTIQYK